MGVDYPLFIFGAVIIAGIIFYIRERNRGVYKGPGLYLYPAPLETNVPDIENITQQVQQIAAGTFKDTQITAQSYPITSAYVSP